MDGNANHFPAKNALDCRISCIQSQTFSGRVTPPDPTEAPSVLGPGHQFPLGTPAFPLFLFYETTTAPSTFLLLKLLVADNVPPSNANQCWRKRVQQL